MEEERSPENEEVLSCSYGHLAALQEAKGDLSAALALYDRQAILLREMIRQSGTDESRCKLMETCCKAKKTLRQLGELDRDDPTCARRWYERGAELLTPYENQAGESWAHGNLAKCLLALGEMEQQDQRPEAREKYRRALRLFTELCTENAKDEIRRGRTVCLTRLAEYCLEEGDATQAQSLCAEGIQCLEKVCVRGTDEETAGDLAYAATVMARACLEQNQTDQAIGWYKNAATWYMELFQATQLAWIYGRAALCRYALSHLEQDWRPWLEEAISIWDTLARECPQIPEYAHHLEVARQELALRLEQEKAPPEQR